MGVIVVLLASLAAVTAVPAFPQRIVGGSVTTISNYPSIAALLFPQDGINFNLFCGGTILSTRSILTAARCAKGDPASKWRFRVGSTYASSGGVVHDCSSIKIHPSFNSGTLDSDIAIMLTNSTMTYSNDVQAASIAGSNYNLGDNQVVWAAGWGATSSGGPASEQLRHVQIWTVNQNQCQQRYDLLRMIITDNMLCAGWLDIGGRDQCQGDSGGPLYHNGIVVGVTSLGEGCASPLHPGVNVRVSHFTTWIQANVEN